MKIYWNRKYQIMARYGILIGCLIVLMAFIVIKFPLLTEAYQKVMAVLNPVIIGLIIAYLMNSLAKIYSRRVWACTEKKKPHPRLRWALSVSLAYITLFLVLGILLLFIVPQVTASYQDLESKASTYVTTILKRLETAAGETGVWHDLYAKALDYTDINRLTRLFTDSFDVILSGSSTVFAFFGNLLNQIKNILLGLIISLYVLADKSRLKAQVKKLTLAILKPEDAARLVTVIRKTDRTFGGFIIGKCIDSLIIGVITFCVLGLFRMPYYPFVSVIVCVTNVIPFFGPIIGAVPSAFIIFVADPVKALWFVVLILIIQQLDGNVIGPKILGGKTGLSSLWVIIAITVMSGLLGLTGMFLGVPIFAVLYAFVKEAVEKRLEKKNLPVRTDEYIR